MSADSVIWHLKQVYTTLLDEKVYLASVSTMYRVLRQENLTGERRVGIATKATPHRRCPL
ncbi:MAG: hypothetical protein R2754_18960 [Microthrixaceae bacterium]